MVDRKFPPGTTNQKNYQDLGSARHQYGISALVTQTSFCEGSSGDLAKRRLFSQATSQAAKGFFRERKHQDAKLCYDWCSVYNSKMLIGPSKNIANNGKGMYVGLKQPLGDGERCVTPARAAAKETN